VRWENSYHHLTMGFLTARGSHATQSGVRTCTFHRLLIGEMDCNIGARRKDARVRSNMNEWRLTFSRGKRDSWGSPGNVIRPRLGFE
jgi:hypothetical protein